MVRCTYEWQAGFALGSFVDAAIQGDCDCRVGRRLGMSDRSVGRKHTGHLCISKSSAKSTEPEPATQGGSEVTQRLDPQEEKMEAKGRAIGSTGAQYSGTDAEVNRAARKSQMRIKGRKTKGQSKPRIFQHEHEQLHQSSQEAKSHLARFSE